MAVRADLAARANELARLSRYAGSAPVLSSQSAREIVCAWLQWNDPNGSHTDDRARADDIDPYTYDTAWEALQTTLEES